jgi:hypothetical protein
MNEPQLPIAGPGEFLLFVWSELCRVFNIPGYELLHDRNDDFGFNGFNCVNLTLRNRGRVCFSQSGNGTSLHGAVESAIQVIRETNSEEKSKLARDLINGRVEIAMSGMAPGHIARLTVDQDYANSRLPQAANKQTRWTVDSSELSSAIDAATRFLIKMCQANGRFIYRTHLGRSNVDSKRYNLLRHAGTIFAMSLAYERSPKEELRSAIIRSTHYLLDQIAPLPDTRTISALWSHPVESDETEVLTAKLGGTGLGLLALGCVERLFPGTVQLEELARLGDFLLFMQRPDGSFHTKYTPATGGFDDKFESLYYPGEGFMGLLAMYQLTRNDTWRIAAENGLLYLCRIREHHSSPPADHWSLLASRSYLKSALQIQHAIRASVIRHAHSICRTILAEQILDRGSLIFGAFSADGRTTPTATRLEGILAALEFLPVDEFSELRDRIKYGSDAGISFLQASQAKSGKATGGFPRAIGHLKTSRLDDAKRFNRRAGEIRIDYVQHALSAMIEFERTIQLG